MWLQKRLMVDRIAVRFPVTQLEEMTLQGSEGDEALRYFAKKRHRFCSESQRYWKESEQKIAGTNLYSSGLCAFLKETMSAAVLRTTKKNDIDGEFHVESAAANQTPPPPPPSIPAARVLSHTLEQWHTHTVTHSFKTHFLHHTITKPDVKGTHEWHVTRELIDCAIWPTLTKIATFFELLLRSLHIIP